MELFEAFARQAYRSLLLRGIVAGLLGLFCLFMPGLSLSAAVALFGAYLFLDGILLVRSGARTDQPAGRRPAGRSWAAIAMGVLSAIAGVLSFYHPGIALVAMVFVIAVRSLVLGGMELGAAFSLPKGSPRAWLAVNGVMSVVFAVILVAYPVPSAVALIWMMGFYALAYGAALAYLAVRVRSATNDVLETPSHPSMPRFSH
jgi:uncharacterized membrane protein HdeD (DUF308 family)